VCDKLGLVKLYRNYFNRNIIAVYLDVPPEIVAKRMERRGDSNEAIMQRLRYDATAFSDAKEYVDFVCDNSTQDKLNENVEFIDMLFRNYRG
jgi:ribose 1,5-bisphosphokinase PhnN